MSNKIKPKNNWKVGDKLIIDNVEGVLIVERINGYNTNNGDLHLTVREVNNTGRGAYEQYNSAYDKNRTRMEDLPKAGKDWGSK